MGISSIADFIQHLTTHIGLPFEVEVVENRMYPYRYVMHISHTFALDPLSKNTNNGLSAILDPIVKGVEESPLVKSIVGDLEKKLAGEVEKSGQLQQQVDYFIKYKNYFDLAKELAGK